VFVRRCQANRTGGCDVSLFGSGDAAARRERHDVTAVDRLGEFLSGHRGWTLALIGAVLALVAAVVFAVWPAASVPGDSGVQGRVWLGPLSPVQVVSGPPNERPYSATIDVLGSDGGLVATARSDRSGHFHVDLRPGTYELRGVPGSNGFPHAVPVSFVVAAHRFTTVRVAFDTGIR
jgi:hypothetical protein